MLFGTSYYPEITNENEWAQDLKNMRTACLDTLRILEFAWSAIEPREGHYQFDWLDRFMDLAHSMEFKVIIGTPTATPPPWLTTQYPEIMIVSRDGVSHKPGGRRDADICNEIYQHYCVEIAKVLAERYGQHPAVIGWQIDNELMGPEAAPPESHSRSATFRFRQYLKRIHGDLATLNQRWGTRFWSQEYSDWGEIGIPANKRATMGQVLDHSRFFSESIRHFIQLQYEVIRPIVASAHWVSTNSTGVFNSGMDHQDWATTLDTVGWDSYFSETFGSNALVHDLFRTAKHQPFWIFETNSLPEPIKPAFWAEMLAHGAQGIIMWHWRNHPANAENETQTFCDWGGTPDPRRVAFMQDIAARAEFKSPIPQNFPRAKAAILYCPDCTRTALTPDPYIHSRREIAYQERLLTPYQVLSRLGIAVDVIQPGTSLEAYDLLVMPSAQLLSLEMAEAIRDFVSQGGTLLGVAKTMHKDQWGHNYNTPGEPLTDVLGFTMARNRTLPSESERIQAQLGEVIIDCDPFVEMVTATTAQVEASFVNGPAQGQPASLIHRYEKGTVYYAAANSEALITDLAQKAARNAQIDTYESPHKRAAIYPDPQGDCVWLFNHSSDTIQITETHIPSGEYIQLTPDEAERLK
ncbi:beta-galactosidase [Coraliomargarita algicola]|uniref:Beta-galactosidase n=1 Tax=Coraliomargarita algicola TaxID=3092156 RepID=A0ABZ0RKP4_9BACT|nr:beta-galactosidase [Coraliomargarita sp. J2-16]WPJ96780.1 beta-galactosidase [Coraliomargarita sp. J2-16]